MRYFKTLSVAGCCFSGVFFFACSSGDSSPSTSTGNGACKHFDYSTYTPPAMPPTFTADIMPLFATTCAASPACHMNGLHPPDLGGTADAATILAGIVGVTAVEVPSMKYVVKGDPQNSWLMRKVEDANPGCGLSCTSPAGFPNGCSQQMPQIPPLLMVSEQAKIRDWIKAGAN